MNSRMSRALFSAWLGLALYMAGLGQALAGRALTMPLGPEGGGIVDLVIVPSAPNRMFALSVSGNLFRSDDAGLSWKKVASGNAPGTVRDPGRLAIDPNNSDIIYLISAIGSRLIKSTDGGENWSPTDESLVESFGGVYLDFSAIAISRQSETLYLGSSNGLYKSTDDGAHWVHLSLGFDVSISTIMIDPITPTTLYNQWC